MKSIKLILSLPIFLVLFSCGGGGSNSGGGGDQMSIAPPMEDPNRVISIVAIGDSIGNGAGYTNQPWPVIVADSLGVPLVNNSVNGRQTAEGLRLIRTLIENNNPSHVLILLGTNDSTKGGTVSGAISNLQEMATIARDLGVIPVIGTTVPNTRSTTFNQKSADIAAGVRMIDNAIIAETRGAMVGNSGLFADDVHPNASGQNVIARAFIDVLR